MAINNGHPKGNTGRNDNVPIKLEAGMAVVFKFKPDAHIFSFELEAGASNHKWCKAVLTSVTDGIYSISYNGMQTNASSISVIVIRSTALADNLKPNKAKRALERAAKRQRKEIVASVKVVRSQIN